MSVRFRHVSSESAGNTGADVFHASQCPVDTGPAFHNASLIAVVEDGGFSVTTQAGSWLARPGSLIALGPGQVHRLKSQSSRGASYRMIQSSTGDRFAGFDRPVINDPRLAFAVQQAHTMLLHSGAVRPALRQLSLTLARVAAMYGMADAPAAIRDEAGIVARAQRFLLERLALPVKLESVALYCGVSVFHLVRVFRRAAGLPPHAWLTQQRINRARALLARGAAVADATYACGFNDQSHLTRQFHASVGVTPGRYRRAVARAISLRGERGTIVLSRPAVPRADRPVPPAWPE